MVNNSTVGMGRLNRSDISLNASDFECHDCGSQFSHVMDLVRHLDSHNPDFRDGVKI